MDSAAMRRLPLICLIISILRLLSGRLVLYKKNLNTDIKTDEGKVFRIFRQIELKNIKSTNTGCVFLVSFKFAHLSHSVNKLTSIIPMLIIAGTPGFITKIYAVDKEEGYWQGMYQWDSVENLNKYKRSFVFRMMNRRAIPESLSMTKKVNESLTNFIEGHKLPN